MSAEIAETKLAVLLTCHNRVQHTLRCLEAVQEQVFRQQTSTCAILVDDGSTDGTAAQVESRFSDVRLIRGSGHLYWNRGMAIALAEALKGDFDFFILLNDDTRMFSNAVQTMLDTNMELRSRGMHDAIVIGATLDPGSGTISYGGWVRIGGWNGLRMRKLPYSTEPQPCDTFNANCALIPRSVVSVVGNLDPVFTHSMGDMDYGFRATRLGCPIWVAGGYVATCTHNAGTGLWMDQSLGVTERWRRLLGPKGLPFAEWRVFTHRHAGPLWPLLWLVPYAKFWAKALMSSLKATLVRTQEPW